MSLSFKSVPIKILIAKKNYFDYAKHIHFLTKSGVMQPIIFFQQDMHLQKLVPTHVHFTETRWKNERKQIQNSEKKLKSIHDFGMNNASTANHWHQKNYQTFTYLFTFCS